MMYGRNANGYLGAIDWSSLLSKGQDILSKTMQEEITAQQTIPLTAAQIDKITAAKRVAQAGLDLAAQLPTTVALRSQLNQGAGYLMKNAVEIETGIDRDWYKLDRDMPIVQRMSADAATLIGAAQPTPPRVPLPPRRPMAMAGMGAIVLIGGALLLVPMMMRGRRRRAS